MSAMWSAKPLTWGRASIAAWGRRLLGKAIGRQRNAQNEYRDQYESMIFMKWAHIFPVEIEVHYSLLLELPVA